LIFRSGVFLKNLLKSAKVFFGLQGVFNQRKALECFQSEPRPQGHIFIHKSEEIIQKPVVGYVGWISRCFYGVIHQTQKIKFKKLYCFLFLGLVDYGKKA